MAGTRDGMARRIVLLDAPTNLGLRPPAKGVSPGCYKLPWALRDRGIAQTIGAIDGGSLVPPRYVAAWTAGDGDRNAEAIAAFSIRLADRLCAIAEGGGMPVVLGGDCSVLIGSLLALKRRGRYGLAFVDAHSDFRHPGNCDAIDAAAGEDLAIATGRGDARLVDLEGLGPSVREEDVHVVGIRAFDAHLAELAGTGIEVTIAGDLLDAGDDTLARILRTVTTGTDGFWIHLDVDVVDEAEMFAVDSPETGGIGFATLARLLRGLLASSHCAGLEVTIYDPDLDPDGVCADRIVRCLRDAFV